MKGVCFLLGSITFMLLAIVGVLGGGQGLIFTYVSIPVSLILLCLGFCIAFPKKDNRKDSKKDEETNFKQD